VERAEHEDARLRCGERHLDRLGIAQLADENRVRVLPERAAQGVRVRLRVRANLALRDHGLQIVVHELDRLLDRDQVEVPRAIDLVDDRRERGALSGARRSRDKHEPVGKARDLPHRCGKAELAHRDGFGGIIRRTAPGAAHVAEQIHAKAREPLDLVRESDVAFRDETFPEMRRRERREQGLVVRAR
jgi:hypothetical protein